MSSIEPTLPGDPYEVRLPRGSDEGAQLFASRRQLLLRCKALLPPSPSVVEVGVLHGFFTDVMLDVLQPGVCHLIDTFNANDHVHGLFTQADHFKYIHAKFDGRREVRLHRGLSWERLAALEDDSCDFIYIDADHSYEAVCRDIAAAVGKLKNGGILQFNDYCTYGTFEQAPYGVLLAVNKFLESAPAVRLVGMSLDRSGYHDLAAQVFKTASPPSTKITLVTPCSRPENLPRVAASIDFTKVQTWFIVHDATPGGGGSSRRVLDPREFPCVVELWCDAPGTAGHPARNMILDRLRNGLVYFVDDDNAVHPGFWDLADTFEPGKIYSFDMVYSQGNVLKGDRPVVGFVDTAQVVFDASLVGALRFHAGLYDADGRFFQALIDSHRDAWEYVPGVYAFYNKLRD